MDSQRCSNSRPRDPPTQTYLWQPWAMLDVRLSLARFLSGGAKKRVPKVMITTTSKPRKRLKSGNSGSKTLHRGEQKKHILAWNIGRLRGVGPVCSSLRLVWAGAGLFEQSIGNPPQGGWWTGLPRVSEVHQRVHTHSYFGCFSKTLGIFQVSGFLLASLSSKTGRLF